MEIVELVELVELCALIGTGKEKERRLETMVRAPAPVPTAAYAVVRAPPGGVVEEPVAMVVLCTADCVPKLECPRDSRAALPER